MVDMIPFALAGLGLLIVVVVIVVLALFGLISLLRGRV
jgi:hypothetical protein